MSTTVARSKQAWRDAGLHEIFLPSGFSVEVRFPSLAELIRADMVPENLRGAALKEVGREGGMPAFLKAALGLNTAEPEKPAPTAEEVTETYELGEWLITQMLVDPELTLDDLRDQQIVPTEDREFLFMLAARYRSTDARGRRIGVMPLEEMEPFPQEHGCKEGCEACARAVAARSTSRGLQL